MSTQRMITHFQKCRTYGHSWDEIPADEPARYDTAMWLRCQRCNTERHDDVSRANGDVLARRYVYPDGYKHAFDSYFADAVPTRHDFRMMRLAEMLNSRRG